MESTRHEEIELKWALDRASHQTLDGALRDHLGSPRLRAQDNRFYDSPDRRLQRAGMSLRLRREDGRVLMTCKVYQGSGDGLHRAQEHECWLNAASWSLVVHGLAPDTCLPLPEPVTATLAGAPMIALGGFSNHRAVFLHGREELCLDRTDFGVRIDHELEIETDDPATTHRTWRERLAAWGIAVSPQLKTKLHRYLETLPG